MARRRGALVFAVLYGSTYLLLWWSGRAGVFMPSSAGGIAGLLLALAVLIGRFTLLVLLPPLVVYRLARGPSPTSKTVS